MDINYLECIKNFDLEFMDGVMIQLGRMNGEIHTMQVNIVQGGGIMCLDLFKVGWVFLIVLKISLCRHNGQKRMDIYR